MGQQASKKSPHKRADAGRQGIQVIARAASVLRALEGEDAGLSLAQIAQRVGLARSTVQRIVESLSTEQFVIAAAPSAGVRLALLIPNSSTPARPAWLGGEAAQATGTSWQPSHENSSREGHA